MYTRSSMCGGGKEEIFLEGILSKRGLKELIELNLGKRNKKTFQGRNYQKLKFGKPHDKEP